MTSFGLSFWGRLIALAAIMLSVGCGSIGKDPLFKMTLRVVDDEGSPVQGAQARIGAERRPRGSESGGRGNFQDGLTDQNGIFIGEVEAWNGTDAGYRVQKEGYYEVWLPYSSDSPPVRGKWLPWNPLIQVVLKRVKNPVPMYARHISQEIPAKGVDVGYDLAMGDWIAPYGRGKIVDMIFHGEGEVKNDRDYAGTLTVTFPGAGNGLSPLESDPELQILHMPYEAPTDGYEPKRIWRSVRRYDERTMRNSESHSDNSNTLNFFIRVRARLSADGKVVGGWYGKIHAPFKFDPRGSDRNGLTGRQTVIFTYYLNPDGTRNVEYDPKRNLLQPPKYGDMDFERLSP